MGEMLNTPVAIFTFNRPQLTERLLGILAQVKPRRILVVSDGPRSHVASDAEKCMVVRRLFDNLDWECRVERNFAESNMGSFPRNSSGLNWVFDQVEEAIILEDDCMPDLSFFPYCEELLERYRDDSRVGLISGNNFLRQSADQKKPSYFFSSYPMTWGWASWRRTWHQVDLNMPYWPQFRDSGKLRQAVFSSSEARYWQSIYDAILERRMNNAWDYQLILACLKFNLLTIVPSVNLVSNVGFGLDSTHSQGANNLVDNVPAHGLKFPLVHPDKVQASKRLGYRIFRRRFHEYWWFRLAKRISSRLYHLLKSFL
ncbi:MAG: glycosyltransferase family 2 protein [Gallionella sp.]